MAAPFEMAWAVLKYDRLSNQQIVNEFGLDPHTLQPIQRRPGTDLEAAAASRPLPDHPDSPEFDRYGTDEEESEELDSRHLPLEDELDPMRVHQEEQEAHRQVSEGLPDPSQQASSSGFDPAPPRRSSDEPTGPDLRPQRPQNPPNPFQQAMSHLSERSGNSVTPDHWKS